MKERVSHHVPPNQKRQPIVRMRGGAPDEDHAGCKWGWNCRNCNDEGETADDKAEAETGDDAAYDTSSDKDEYHEVHHVQHPLMQLNDKLFTR